MAEENSKTINELCEEFPFLTRKKLQAWEKKQWITAEEEGERGRGKARLYSSATVRKIRVIVAKIEVERYSEERAHEIAQSEISPRVLVIEDDHSSRELLEKYLSGLCRLEMVTTSADALRRLRDEQRVEFELVILDLQLPFSEGRKASTHEGKKVLEKLVNQHRCFLLTTATNTAELAGTPGLLAIFEKPFPFRKCAQVVKNYLDMRVNEQQLQTEEVAS